MKNSLNIINTYKFLKFFSRNLNSIFVPILIFQTTNSLFFAFTYLALTSLFMIIFNLIFKKIIIKNLKFILFLSTIIFIIMQILLIFNNINIILYSLILGFLSGMDNVLTMSPIDYMYNICEKSDKTPNLRNTLIIEIISTALAPIIGGIILSYLGILYNAILACIFSIIPTIIIICLLKNLKLQEIKKQINQMSVIKNSNLRVSLLKKQFIKSKYKYFPVFLSVSLMFTIGILIRMNLSWGLYLNALNIEFVTIGLLSGIISLGQILFTLITYKMQIRYNTLSIVIISATLITVSYLTRIYIYNYIFLYITTIIISVLYPFLYQPIKKNYMQTLKNFKSKSILYMDEFVKQIGCLFISLIGLILSTKSILGMQIMFIVGCIFIFISPVLYYLQIKINKKTKQNIFFQNNLTNNK